MRLVQNVAEVMPQQMYPYGGVVYNQNYAPPVAQNVLTAEEIKLIKRVPENKLNLDISKEEFTRGICNHHHLDGRDAVQQTADGNVFCPICSIEWNPEKATVEDVKKMVDYLLDAFQNAKWIGYLPPQLTRDFFSIAALLEKFPDIYEYAINNLNKYANVNAYSSANDASPYAHYNNIMGGAGYYQQPYAQYMPAQQPMMNGGYYQQPMMGQAPMDPNMGGAMMQNPMQNPMQMPMNTQFTDQANMFMNGGYYQQPMMGQPQPQMQMAQQPVQQPAAPVYQPTPAQQSAEVVNESGEATTTTTVTL